MGFNFGHMKGRAIFQGKYICNYENAFTNLKIFFTKTTGPISTKIGRHHPQLKRSQVYSNERPCYFPGEILTKKGKYIDKIKNLSLKNQSAIRPFLARSILGWFFIKWRPSPFPRVNNYEIKKIEKSFSLDPLDQFQFVQMDRQHLFT